MNLVISAIFTLIITILFLAGLYTSRDWSIQARLFPWTIGLPTLCLCLLQLFMALWKAVRREPEEEDDRGIMDLKVDKDVAPALVVRRAANIFAWISGLFAGHLAGWFPGQYTVVYLVLYAFSGTRNVVEFSGLDRCDGGFYRRAFPLHTTGALVLSGIRLAAGNFIGMAVKGNRQIGNRQ